ncbi:MAG: calcium/sodium antiporter [Bacteroidota bacterium]
MNIFFIVIGFALLVIGGEFLVRAAVGLSFKLQLSKMVIGLTVVSFATSAPELLVSLNAALKGASDIATGNVIGSNIANIGLVLGITALIMPMNVDRDFFRLNWPVMMIFSGLFYWFLYSSSVIDRTEGIILVVLLVIYLIILIRRAHGAKVHVPIEEIDESLKKSSYFKIIIWLLIGGTALYFGSEFLVDGSVKIAEKYGVSERVISVTMIAFGTSVPELAASVISAIKGEKAMSLGNLIGSNIFNIASVIGLTAIVQDIELQSSAVLTNDMVWMIAIAAFLVPLALFPRKMEISRYKGLLLFIVYGVFLFFLI